VSTIDSGHLEVDYRGEEGVTPSGRPDSARERPVRRQVTQDPVRTRVRHFPEVRAPGQVSPHEAVGMPGRPALPVAVGPREKEVCAERPGHSRVVRELPAAVGGDRVDGKGSRHAGHGGPDRVRGLPVGPPRERVPRRAVHQRRKRAAGPGPDGRVGLPVADPRPPLHRRRSVRWRIFGGRCCRPPERELRKRGHRPSSLQGGGGRAGVSICPARSGPDRGPPDAGAGCPAVSRTGGEWPCH